MKNIIDIRLKHIYPNLEKLQGSIIQIFSSIIEKAKNLKLWDNSIISIVITDNFHEDIKRQSDEWESIQTIRDEREYEVISKILSRGFPKFAESIIFIKFESLVNDSVSIEQIFYNQLLTIKADMIFPQKIRDFSLTNGKKNLNTYFTASVKEWIKSYYVLEKLKSIIEKPTNPINHNSFLNAFKRSLKRELFTYNNDLLPNEVKITNFWKEYYQSINVLFQRILDNETDMTEYKIIDDDECKNFIYDIVEEVKKITSELIIKNYFNIEILVEKIKAFSRCLDIDLLDETEDNIRISFTKNPKDYFKDLVDTEPRIVCFLDILGFSDFINSYESDITSMFLQDVQESFSTARAQLLDNKNNYNREAIQYLEYQTFSDNICVSIPYFDNENDFLSNLNILTIYIRSFQLIMMSKGFFTRGGISLGSYYADKNIIFSKGLVNAYNLENKKAIYPRAILDKEIVGKILKYDPVQVRSFGLDRAIILDWENQAFLNPLGLIESTIQQLNSTLNAIQNDDDDPTSKLLGSITKVFGKMTVDLLKSTEVKEKENIAVIKDHIARNLYFYQNDEHIYSKYVWLQELFKWLEKDGTEKLKFYYLTDVLTEND